MFKKFVSLMLVVCVMLTVCITASAEGVEPAKPADGQYPITIESATCVGRTVTVKYTINAEKKVDDMDVTVLFYQPVGPEGDKKYITYNDTNAIYYADQVENDVANGKLTFSIPNGAPEGTYNVLVGGTGIDYPALRTGVEVKKAFKYGDIDENDKINSTDALIVAKYGIGIKDTTVNDTINNPEKTYLLTAADVDGNGKQNATDALNIAKYGIGDKDAKAMIDALNDGI